MFDAICKTQALVSLNKLGARRTSQPEQALPQTVARLVRIGIGPEQRCRARTRCRSIEREQCEQGGVLALERYNGRIGAHKRRRGQKLQPCQCARSYSCLNQGQPRKAQQALQPRRYSRLTRDLPPQLIHTDPSMSSMQRSLRASVTGTL